ncbi:hypothetical protein C8R44DRAFT_851603 [Mycena epipterygia]|nr:hypothetical protein C8R44DRAFT_851603 [Mycena epipterygia]
MLAVGFNLEDHAVYRWRESVQVFLADFVGWLHAYAIGFLPGSHHVHSGLERVNLCDKILADPTGQLCPPPHSGTGSLVVLSNLRCPDNGILQWHGRQWPRLVLFNPLQPGAGIMIIKEAERLLSSTKTGRSSNGSLLPQKKHLLDMEASQARVVHRALQLTGHVVGRDEAQKFLHYKYKNRTSVAVSEIPSPIVEGINTVAEVSKDKMEIVDALNSMSYIVRREIELAFNLGQKSRKTQRRWWSILFGAR